MEKGYCDAVISDCAKLNTPKFGPTTELLKRWLDVCPDELEAAWLHDDKNLNIFLTVREEIAHLGADAPYVRRDKLKEYAEMIDHIVIDTDNFLGRHLKLIGCEKIRPWNSIPVAAVYCDLPLASCINR